MENNVFFIDIYMIITFVITYFICSINPAIIICKKKTGQDIRKLGSGNAGSANAMRVLRKSIWNSCNSCRCFKSFNSLCIDTTFL